MIQFGFLARSWTPWTLSCLANWTLACRAPNSCIRSLTNQRPLFCVENQTAWSNHLLVLWSSDPAGVTANSHHQPPVLGSLQLQILLSSYYRTSDHPSRRAAIRKQQAIHNIPVQIRDPDSMSIIKWLFEMDMLGVICCTTVVMRRYIKQSTMACVKTLYMVVTCLAPLPPSTFTLLDHTLPSKG